MVDKNLRNCEPGMFLRHQHTFNEESQLCKENNLLLRVNCKNPPRESSLFRKCRRRPCVKLLVWYRL